MKLNMKLIFCTASLIGAVGCSSWVDSSKKLITDEEEKQTNARKKVMSKWIPRSQYDELLAKYKNLEDKQTAQEQKNQTSPKNFNQIDELSNSLPSNTETVDVFGKNGLAQKVESSAVPVTLDDNEPKSLIKDLKTYKKGLALRSNGKVDESLRVFQYLEKSRYEQVTVRARMQIGEIYLEKNQYDLSLQVFEKVISSHAFSGKVLDALKGAAASSAGLGLSDKKLRYQSMLKDFFGIQG